MSTSDIIIYRFDASSCNGCDIEILGILALGLALDELGVKIVDTPQEANTLIISGGVNVKSGAELEKVYELIEPPRRVIAVGSCAADTGIFKNSYAMAGPIDEIIPVDLYIMGCPPRPQVIVSALADFFKLNIEGLEPLLETPEFFRGKPIVDKGKCIGCGACVSSCPAGAIEIEDSGRQRIVSFRHKDCICCATCQDVCPTEAIEMVYQDKLWFTDKETGTSEAAIELKNCLLCGLPFAASRQIDWAVKKIGENLTIPEEAHTLLVRKSNICPTCRRSIDEIKEAKKILAATAVKTP